MYKKLFLAIIMTCFALPAHAQGIEYLSSFTEDTLPVLNDTLQFQEYRINKVESDKFGTTSIVPLLNGGTGSALVDPDVDSFIYWDDSDGASEFLEIGTGFTITGGTTISAVNNLEFFDSSGTFTVPTGVTTVFVTGCGAGGGGASGRQGSGISGASGGEAGEFNILVPISVTPEANVTVTIGSKGVGGTPDISGIDGTAGGDTSFGGSLTLDGGLGGDNSGTSIGTGQGFYFDSTGQTGGTSNILGGKSAAASINVGSGGGATIFGAGGTGGNQNASGQDGSGYCSAGGGSGIFSGDPVISGGDGTDGFLIVQW